MLRIGREIQCLPYAEFLFKILIDMNTNENVPQSVSLRAQTEALVYFKSLVPNFLLHLDLPPR